MLLLLSVTLPAAEQQGVIVREAQVYDGPGTAFRQVGSVRAGTLVNLFGRKGGWEEIFAEREALIGWVRSYQVRTGVYAPQVEVEEQPDSRGFLSGLAAFSRKASRFFSSGGAGSSSGTATIGVRGLSEEEIRSARPNAAELVKMQGFVSSPERVQRFRDEGRLAANDVAHLKPRKNSGR